MGEDDRGITDILIDEILTNVELLLKIDANEKEYEYKIEVITLYIRIICNEILILTNRTTFPTDLKYLVVTMVVDTFNGDSINSDLQSMSIQSMSEAGRSVNFGTSGVIQTRLQLLAQEEISKNNKLINRYKLLYRTSKAQVSDNE